MIGYKAIHLVPENGNIIELETIWNDTGTDINYHKSTPNFIVSRYVSIVNVTTNNSYANVEGKSRLFINVFDVEGYELIGWSKTQIFVEETDSINVNSLFGENQEISYGEVRNDEFKLDLYTIWKRKPYNYTKYINDDREE